MELKDIFRTVRKKKNLSAEQLAELCELPHQMIYFFEAGVINLPYQKIFTIAKILEIEISAYPIKNSSRTINTILFDNIIFLRDLRLNK